MNIEKASAILKRAIEILFVANPVSTSMGVLFGIVLESILELTKGGITKFTGIDPGSIGMWRYIVIGIFLFNVPSLLKRKRLDENIENAFAFVKSAEKEGRLNRIDSKQAYRNIVRHVLDGVALNAEIQQKAILLGGALEQAGEHEKRKKVLENEST